MKINQQTGRVDFGNGLVVKYSHRSECICFENAFANDESLQRRFVLLARYEFLSKHGNLRGDVLQYKDTIKMTQGDRREVRGISIMEDSTKKVYGLLIATSILWGANPIAVKHVLGEMSPILIVLTRFLGMSLILLAVIAVKERWQALPPKKHVPALILMGLTGVGINNGLQYTGLVYSSVVNCVLVSALTPALTAFLAGVFLKERMRIRQWIGIFISLSGVVFLVAHGSLEVIRHLAFNQGDLMFLGGQLGWAAYSLLGRRVMQDLSPMATTAWAGLAGAAFMGMAALVEGTGSTQPLSNFSLVAMVYMIIGSGILAFSWWNVGVAEVGPNRASIFLNVIPLAGVLFSVFLLHERIGWNEIAGGAFILLGVYLTIQRQTAQTA